MKYFLPDSQDLVDPSFDFTTERRSATRLRQRDDVYAHELFEDRVTDGILVSKGIVDGIGGSGGRYTLAQRHRLLRAGAPDFFRLGSAKGGPLVTMGDCGAFTYVAEPTPPYSVDDVISFYVDCQFDLGISVDHVILDYEPAWDSPRGLDTEQRKARDAARSRQDCTLELAQQFLTTIRSGRLPVHPVGVAQGWSGTSYARAVTDLQKMGYDYIAIGGMVPLKTPQVLEILEAVSRVRQPKTRLHLLGITRTESMPAFAKYGVTSFDSTSPLRQAFKDDRDNYYTPTRTYSAIRIPQLEGNPKLQKSIQSGRTSQPEARALEKACLDVMARLDRDEASVDEALEVLTKFDLLFEAAAQAKARGPRKHVERYREVLTDRPWKDCPCAVCRDLGHHVVIFRGAERNRRRGLHNVWVFYRQVQAVAGSGAPKKRTAAVQSTGVAS